MGFKPKHVATLYNESLLSGEMIDSWFAAYDSCALNKVGCLM